ncbi:MAG: T9SS type A sorting domain-containing protein [Crocinitomicaceae bacterium]|nr:T9SS type A sorting domain-containing protein [Crocinitomicaceae bacterium]
MTSYSDTVVWGVGENGYVVTNVDFSQLSILENNQQNKLKVYPNPAKNLLNIEIPIANEKTEIEIYDTRGKLVLQNHQDIKHVNISS